MVRVAEKPKSVRLHEFFQASFDDRHLPTCAEVQTIQRTRTYEVVRTPTYSRKENLKPGFLLQNGKSTVMFSRRRRIDALTLDTATVAHKRGAS